MMKKILTTIILFFNLFCAIAQEEKPTITKMWSRTEGIKNFVFDIESDSVSLNFSEKDKWLASNIKTYSIVANSVKDLGGRLVVLRDSVGIEHYRTIDYLNLTMDSLKIFLHPEYFADKEQAEGAVQKKLNDMKTFYTTEYLYYKKVEEKAPSLKKTDYIAFLKEAQAEAKKRAVAKTLNLDPKKPIDKRVEEFLYDYAKDKKYRGKIFPGNLEKAIKANAKDENVTKLLAGIKTNFVVKKTTDTQATDTKDKKGSTSKETSNTDKQKTGKDKDPNNLIIKTEEKKGTRN